MNGKIRAACVCALVWAGVASAADILNVRDFGARGDGRTLDTAAIQKAITACPAGGTVRLPPGVYRSGALFLKSAMTFEVARDAVLKGSDDPADYPVFVYRFEGLEQRCFASLLNTAQDGTVRSRDITVCGGGVIDANGAALRPRELKADPVRRGRAVCLRGVDGLTLRDVTIGGSPAWCLHLVYCRDVTIANVRIDQREGWNGDGVDLDSCERVRMTGCDVRSSDDSVAVKSGRDAEGRRVGIPSRDIVIEDCVFRKGFGVAVGSEMAGGVSNVTVRNCRFIDTKSLASVKAPRGRGGVVQDIVYERCTHSSPTERHGDCEWFRGALNVDMFYSVKTDDFSTPQPRGDGTPAIRRVTFRDCTVDTSNGRAVWLAGLPEAPLQDIVFENVTATGEFGMAVHNVRGLVRKNLRVTARAGGAESNEIALKSEADARKEERAVKDVLARRIRTSDTSSFWAETAARVYAADVAADRAWREIPTAELPAAQERMRARMRAAMGGFPERCALDARVTDTVRRDGYTVEKVVFASRPGFHVTGLFFRPEGAGPFPCTVIACGHSGDGKGSGGYQRGCALLARAGIAAFIFDPLLQGERGQGRGVPTNCAGHNAVGVRAALLGRSMAAIRVWDAMRAFDYVCSRADVDAARLGMAGNSGGGTETALTMALEPRIRAAAPSCYLTSLRALIMKAGPQDAEQNIFGQLTFGLNHAGYIAARAPSPVLLVAKENDFFPLAGATDSAAVARDVFTRLGRPEAFSFLHVPGPHGWVESTRQGTVAWMRRWLKGEADAFNAADPRAYRTLDPGFVLKEHDRGLEAPEVLPKGGVMTLPGERTAIDLLADELTAAEQTRTLPTDPTARAARVAAAAGIRAPARAARADVWVVTNQEFVAHGVALTPPTGPTLSGVLFEPRDGARGVPALVLAPDVCGGRTGSVARVRGLLAEGRAALVADLRGFGETDWTPTGAFYHHPYREEPLAVIHYLLGENLVARRAEDILSWTEVFGDAGAVEVYATGRTAIPAAHARACFPVRIVSLKLESAPPAWAQIVRTPSAVPAFTDIVNGGLRTYDWTDLLRD